VDISDLLYTLLPSSEVGYLALSLISFLGSLLPFIPVPYFLLLATMSVGEQFNIHLLAILSAITATAAKQIIFAASYGGSRIITEKTKKRMRPFQRLVKRYGAFAAFIAAATPIPDDLVYIPLGLSKYNPMRFFIATLAGKIVLSYVIVLSSSFFGLSFVEPYLVEVENPNVVYIGIFVFTAMTIVIVVLLLRLNWGKILGRVAPWTLEENENKE